MSVLDTVTALYNEARTALANKVIDLASNTLTGTTAQFNAALSDGDFVTSTAGLPLDSPVLTTPVINGAVTGTGQSAASTASTLAARDAQANLLADSFIAGADSTATAAGTTTLTVDSKQIQLFTGATTQIVALPTTGVVAGQSFWIIDASTGNVTINSSNGGNVTTVVAGQMALVVALQATPTSNTHWAFFRTYPITAASTASTLALRDGNGLLVAINYIRGLNTIVTAAGTTALSVFSSGIQVLTGATTQTVTLPSSSVVAGQSWTFLNPSSGAITINSSAGNLVKTLAAGASTVVTCLTTTPTTAAHWYATA